MGRAVLRGRKRKPRQAVRKMGVDEKFLGKGHNYLTLVYDLEAATVEHIEDDRRKESLDRYFSLLGPEQRAMFCKYLKNILPFFTHRVTSAVSKALNSTIQTVKKKACGFRNREHFKTAIYFHCGRLDLLPVTHKNVG